MKTTFDVAAKNGVIACNHDLVLHNVAEAYWGFEVSGDEDFIHIIPWTPGWKHCTFLGHLTWEQYNSLCEAVKAADWGEWWDYPDPAYYWDGEELPGPTRRRIGAQLLATVGEPDDPRLVDITAHLRDAWQDEPQKGSPEDDARVWRIVEDIMSS